MRGTGLFINWESGNKNSNAIQEFEKTASTGNITTLEHLQPTFTASGFLKRSILNISKAMCLKSA